MDSSDDWALQGLIPDSSSSPSADMLITCSRPSILERRLRPQNDQALNCPRCDSTNTKFCYYNNYSLSQPRYFCKTCRRYWTKGGTLRNIPVGGGCRKNKKSGSSSKKPSLRTTSSSSSLSSLRDNRHVVVDDQIEMIDDPVGLSPTTLNQHIDLPLSNFPHDQVLQLSHLQFTNLMGVNSGFDFYHYYMQNKYDTISALDQNSPKPIDFMESSKFEDAMARNTNASTGHQIGGDNINGIVGGGLGDLGPRGISGICSSPFGGVPMDNLHNLMLPLHDGDGQDIHDDVKPNTKLLSLVEWQDQGSSPEYHQAGKDSFGCSIVNNLATWSGGITNCYGPSFANPLI